MLQLYVLLGAAVLSFGGGYLTSSTFHEAADAKALKQAIADLTIDAQDKITGLNDAWLIESEKQSRALVKASKLRQADEARESVVLERLEVTRNELRKINERMAFVGDVGVCRLDDEFIRVWNDISRATRARRTEAELNDAAGSSGS